MNTYRIFVASSFRLAEEREALKERIARINDDFSKRNVYLQLDIWEKFDSANDPIRKQSFYNEYIPKTDIFLILYQSELGAFTLEEYTEAQELFAATGQPRIYIFKKTAPADYELNPTNVENLRLLENEWYAKGKEQWPWEFNNKAELTQKLSDDIRGLFDNPDLPHFSFPEVIKLSLNSPEMPVGFLGREEELKTIYQKLNSGGKLMLINAEGGIGKTTLAAKYWNEALNYYKHAAWLFCDSGVINSLKEMAPQLDIDLNGMDEQQQIQALKQKLHAVQNEFLLVLDNLNNEEDIRLFRQEFEGFRWHVLITSRCRGILDKEQELPIEHLPPPLAKELFERYYRGDTQDFSQLLDQVLKAINYHTLLTEVFAKNLAEAAELGEMDLATFLNRLENEGLFLREQSFEIENNEWAAKRKAATTDQILDALYDFGQLTEDQRFLLVNMALLPAEPYILTFINSLLVKEPERAVRQVRDTLKGLVRKGWISETDRSYRLSPVIQKLVLEKHAETLDEDSKDLLERLNYITEADAFNLVRTSLKDAAPYIQPVHHITLCLKQHPGYEIAKYNFHAGVYYTNLGDLINAQKTYINFGNICKALLLKEPDVLEYKSGLAISYQRLGNIYMAKGDQDNALDNYEKCYTLSKEIHESSPDNLEYKRGLAISYQHLGNIYIATGDTDNALDNYEKYNTLSKEIHESSPDNLEYKRGLAISYLKLGNIYMAKGDRGNALDNYQKYNTISKEIHEGSPDNLEYKSGLAISHQHLGNIYMAKGDRENALDNYEKYNTLSKEIHESSPDTLEYKRGLAISYQYLGNIYMAKGDRDNALDNYQKFYTLSKEIHESSPDTLQYKNTLAISYQHLGNIYEATGDQDNALDNYEKYNTLSKEIHESSPDNLEYKRGLAVSYQYLGNIYMAKGDRDNALDNYQKFYTLSKEIHESSPDTLQYKNTLAISYFKLGSLYIKENKVFAIENITQSFALYEELVEKAPEVTQYSQNYNYIKQYLEELTS